MSTDHEKVASYDLIAGIVGVRVTVVILLDCVMLKGALLTLAHVMSASLGRE